MKIAVTYENGNIFQHFGHTETFKLYDVENNTIKSEQTVSTNGRGHGELVEFLSENGVNALICGGIGGGAKASIEETGIKLYAGVNGNADEAVKHLLAGTLDFDSNAHCENHDHEQHNCHHK